MGLSPCFFSYEEAEGNDTSLLELVREFSGIIQSTCDSARHRGGGCVSTEVIAAALTSVAATFGGFVVVVVGT